jgi:putative membrane protein
MPIAAGADRCGHAGGAADQHGRHWAPCLPYRRETPMASDRSGEVDREPDARFTFANERTFLAWHRTALALVVAGLAIVQLLPAFPGIPYGRLLLALPLIALGGGLSVASYREWSRHQRALRRGAPVTPSLLPRILAVAITLLALVAALLSLLAHR